MRPESLEALGVIEPPSQSRLENYRREIPAGVAAVTQVLVDNPKPFVLMFAGSYVLSGAMVTLVRPRGLIGVLSCAIVSATLGAAAATELVKRGIIEIRIRDDDGRLVPAFPRGDA